MQLWIQIKEKYNLKTLNEMCKHFVTYSMSDSFFQLLKVFKIYLAIPVSSAEAERSFSCLNLLKNCLRTTMGQERLSSLAVININKDILRKVDLDKIIDIFAEKDDRRIQFK